MRSFFWRRFLSVDRIDLDELFKRLLMLQCYFIGFPRTSDQDIELASEYQEYQSELKYYQLLRKEYKFLKTFSSAFGLFIIFKAIHHITSFLTTASELDKNLSQVANNLTQVISFDCLRTSCHRRDLLITLPIFSLCRPRLRIISNVLVESHTLGAVFHVIFALLIGAAGFFTVLYYHLNPIGHEMLMFNIAPNIGQQRLKMMIKSFIAGVYVSMLSYVTLKPREIHQLVQGRKDKPIVFSGKPATSVLVFRANNKYHARIYYKYARKKVVELDGDFDTLGEPSKLLINDCLSTFRVLEMCRYTAMKQQVLITIVFSLTTVIAFISLAIFNIWEASRYKNNLKNIQQSIDKNNCSVWYANDPNRLIDLINFKLNLGPYQYFEIACGAAVVSFLVACGVGNFYVISREIHNMIREQIYRLTMVLEMSYLLESPLRCRSNVIKKLPAEEDQSCLINGYDFKHLNYVVATELCPIIDLNKLKSLFGFRAHRTEYVARNAAVGLLIARGPNLHAFFNLMIKIYCCNRVLITTVKQSSKNLSTVMFIALSMNFTAIGLVKLVTYKIRESSNLQFFLASASVLVNIGIILYPSIIQATSRKIIRLMWDLLASTVDFQDLRIQQMRSLYLKQLRILCHEDGMTLRAYGVPVTYGAVIRLFLWSATLVVVSYDSGESWKTQSNG